MKNYRTTNLQIKAAQMEKKDETVEVYGMRLHSYRRGTA